MAINTAAAGDSAPPPRRPPQRQDRWPPWLRWWPQGHSSHQAADNVGGRNCSHLNGILIRAFYWKEHCDIALQKLLQPVLDWPWSTGVKVSLSDLFQLLQRSSGRTVIVCLWRRESHSQNFKIVAARSSGTVETVWVNWKTHAKNVPEL